MKKTFVIILVLVVIVLGGYFFLKNEEAKAPSDIDKISEETPTSTSGMPAPNTNTPETIVKLTGDINKSPAVDQNVITYGDTGYSPNLLTIKAGETVTFKNNSSLSMWPASAFHPTHKVYPTTGGCLGSTFDACKGVLPGGLWSFKFDIAGSWKYHDHLKPTVFGTVIVE